MDNSITEGRAQPLGKYPHLRRAGGFLFVSGTTARLPEGGIAGVSVRQDGSVQRDAAVQTRVVLENIRSTLGAAGAGLEDCVEIVVFLTDMADFAAYNAAYAEYFNDNAPARTTIGVGALPHPDMVVEMKAIAFQAARQVIP